MSIERKRNEKTDSVYFIASLPTLEKQPVGHCTNLLPKQGQNIAYSIWVYFTCAQHKYNHIQVFHEVSIKANNHYYTLWGNSLLILCDIVERYKAKYLEYWHKYFMWYGYLYCPCISVVIAVIYSERHIFPLSENCDLTILTCSNEYLNSTWNYKAWAPDALNLHCAVTLLFLLKMYEYIDKLMVPDPLYTETC